MTDALPAAPNSPDRARISAAYRRFAAEEAHGRSALYETLARGVAEDAGTLEFLAALPREKRQPNLLFAAVRFLFGTPSDWHAFRDCVLGQAAAVRSLMSARATQTNEPGRCAVSLPVLALLPPPLALLEVGASAGLCLLPDRYGYDYGGMHRLLPPDGPAPACPVLPCAADAATPLPSALPQIVWRAGLDLAPIDVADRDQAAWLEALVWPEQQDRLARLRAAMAIAAANPPRVTKGDLRRDLAALAAEAPRDATLVIFHTAVLAYVRDLSERIEFARAAQSLADIWLSNEAPEVFPEIAARVDASAPRGRFLLAVNGRPVAWTDPHGASMSWIADPPDANARLASLGGTRRVGVGRRAIR